MMIKKSMIINRLVLKICLSFIKANILIYITNKYYFI